MQIIPNDNNINSQVKEKFFLKMYSSLIERKIGLNKYFFDFYSTAKYKWKYNYCLSSSL